MATLCLAVVAAESHAQKIKVATDVSAKAKAHDFRDGRNGVRFRVPAGWTLNRKDGQVSTFRLDARTATQRAQMRAVASLDFNPYPLSTFSSALFYYSVERHTTDAACAAQASSSKSEDVPEAPILKVEKPDVQNIGGMNFVHGHDEHGDICVEARDEVYTAFRRGSCYRFDLTVNTFCSASSGARDLSVSQMRSIEERMAGILSTVALDWEKSGPREVPVPEGPVARPGVKGIVVGGSL